MNFKFYDECLNTLKHSKKDKLEKQNLIQLHFDEKWIFNHYIKRFINIEPTEIDLTNFIKELDKKENKRLVITTGFILPTIMRNILPILRELKIEIYENLNFSQLEKITCKSSILISCHGAISHVAAANNIKQIDIIDRSYNYAKWTAHFRNYNFVHRENFNSLTQKILEKI